MRNFEKGLAFGLRGSGEYVITGIIALGSDGGPIGSFARQTNAIAVWHNHWNIEHVQQPAGADHTPLSVFGIPSFVWGGANSTLYEVVRQNNVYRNVVVNRNGSIGQSQLFRIYKQGEGAETWPPH